MSRRALVATALIPNIVNYLNLAVVREATVGHATGLVIDN